MNTAQETVTWLHGEPRVPRVPRMPRLPIPSRASEHSLPQSLRANGRTLRYPYRPLCRFGVSRQANQSRICPRDRPKSSRHSQLFRGLAHLFTRRWSCQVTVHSEHVTAHHKQGHVIRRKQQEQSSKLPTTAKGCRHHAPASTMPGR